MTDAQPHGGQAGEKAPLYQVLAEDITAMGVEAVFGLMSDDTALFATALDTAGVRFYGARHENNAIAMADGYAYATGKLGIAVIGRKAKTLKDQQGQAWYEVNVHDGQPVTGLIRKPNELSCGEVEIISQHDWEKLGYRIVEEKNSNADGFLDLDRMPDFFQSLFQEVDHLGDKNGQVSPTELKTALRTPFLRSRWSKLVAFHPTEWQAKSSAPKWQRLKDLLKGSPELLKHEQERIDNLVFWDEMSGVMQLPLPEKVYHLHPIAFIDNLIPAATPMEVLIRRIGDIIAHGEGSYESYNTGTKDVLNNRVGHSFVSPPPGTVTGKTINSIIATEGLSGTNKARMFATGKYQTVIRTLKAAKEKMNLSGEELYSAEMQERVFREYLIEKAGGGALARFIKSGQGSVDDAQYAASKEWASIATPAGRTIGDGSVSDGTLSYYESRANRANSESTSLLRNILQEIGHSR
jgi:hypothetical protein